MADHDDNGLDRVSDNFDAFTYSRTADSDYANTPTKEWAHAPQKKPTKNGLSRSFRNKARITDASPAASTDKVIIGSSPEAQALREKIVLYTESNAPVIIVGESGVGKELAAKLLHTTSAHRKKSFVPVNAGAIPETLATAEFFGHVKGAFTGAIADREGAIAAAKDGTLFIDEIGEMPLSLQPYLLRVLEDGLVTKVGSTNASKINFRLISATNVDLQKHVDEGRFRLDLFYRVNVLVINVPPLRVRGDDVVEIAQTLIASHENDTFRDKKLTPMAADRLKAHSFPGNVRELRNVLTRALTHSRNGKILPDDLIFDGGALNIASDKERLDIDTVKELVGRYLILKALKIANGNVTKAAVLTGRSRGTVHSLMKQIERKDFDAEFASACKEIKSVFQDTCFVG